MSSKNAEKIKAGNTRESRAGQYRPSVQVKSRLSVLRSEKKRQNLREKANISGSVRKIKSVFGAVQSDHVTSNSRNKELTVN